MNTRYQMKTLDLIILALEDLIEFYEEPQEKMFVIKRVDYYTNRLCDIKAGINKPLYPNEKNEHGLILKT